MIHPSKTGKTAHFVGFSQVGRPHKRELHHERTLTEGSWYECSTVTNNVQKLVHVSVVFNLTGHFITELPLIFSNSIKQFSVSCHACYCFNTWDACMSAAHWSILWCLLRLIRIRLKQEKTGTSNFLKPVSGRGDNYTCSTINQNSG